MNADKMHAINFKNISVGMRFLIFRFSSTIKNCLSQLKILSKIFGYVFGAHIYVYEIGSNKWIV